MKKNFASKILSFFALIFFLSNSIAIISIYFIHSSLHEESTLINNIGLIRGSTQRILKLELLNQFSSANENIDKVDKIFSVYIIENGSAQTSLAPELYGLFKALHEEWIFFKKSLHESRAGDKQYMEKAFLRSESIWSGSNFIMLRKIAESNYKTENIKKLYYHAFFLFVSSLILYTISRLVIQKIEFHSTYDSLTSILNRSQFNLDLKEEVNRFGRNKKEFSLFIIDIDHFKKVNDSFGHAEGDRVLQKMVNAVKQCIRKTDFFYRIGGEEFAVLAPETGPENARILAEKIRKFVEKEFLEDKIKITISIGISVYTDEINIDDFFKQADLALYEAKRSGRNQSVVFSKN